MIFVNSTVSLCFVPPPGSLEDWDVAVQKTETRMNRINEQRAKVGERRILPRRWIIELLLANVTTIGPSVRRLRKRPSWLAKRKRELISGGRPSQTRKLRRRPRRNFELGRRGKQSRMIIRMSGTRTRVNDDDDLMKLFFFFFNLRDFVS